MTRDLLGFDDMRRKPLLENRLGRNFDPVPIFDRKRERNKHGIHVENSDPQIGIVKYFTDLVANCVIDALDI